MISENERQAESTPTAATAQTGGRREAVGLGTVERTAIASDSAVRAAAYSASEGSGEISDITKFEIECLNNAKYHEDREQFFSFANKLALFFIVLSGTAALSPLKTIYPNLFAIVITVLGLLNLVFNISDKAKLHGGLRKDTYNVLADLKIGMDISSLQKRLVLLYADEPPVMYAVSAIAYNSAMKSLDRPRNFLVKVSWWARFWRHIWPYSANSFKTFEELGKTG